MTTGLLFWVIMLIALLFGIWGIYSAPGGPNWHGMGMSLVLWVLLALLGWEVFGPAIKRSGGHSQ